jgi:hypothetical protein
MMGSEERYLWLCEFRLHGEERIWWAYFKDQQEVEEFFQLIVEILPCIVFGRLEALVGGFCVGLRHFYYRLSDYLRAEEERKRYKLKLHAKFGQPAPLARTLLVSFLRDLPQERCCAECAPMLSVMRNSRVRVKPGYQSSLE